MVKVRNDLEPIMIYEETDLWYEIIDNGMLSPKKYILVEEDREKVMKSIKIVQEYIDELEEEGMVEFEYKLKEEEE